MKKLALFSALLISVAACGGVSNSNGTMAPEKKTSGFMGSTTNNDVEVNTPKAFAGKNEVIIGNFKVGFVTFTKAKKTAKGGFLSGNSSWGKASAHVTLDGISDADMQAITETAYNDFVKTLKANGYTIADRSKLENAKHYSNLKPMANPDKKEGSFFSGATDKLTVVSPKALPFYYYPGEAGERGGIGFSNAGSVYGGFASESGIPVLSVYYTVDFANAGGYGGYRNWASLEVGQGMSIRPGSGIQFVGGQGGTFATNIGAVTLGQAVFSDEKFGEMQDTTTDAGKAGMVAANVLSVALGQGTNQYREYDVDAKPADYKKLATKILAEANDKLVTTMASNR
ncbi:MAG: hypothetical protein MK052_10735 [Alphaproteobacteria bacterium]|nr:hypothetical protein [Alphaproteobacteria bacterium]